MKKIALLSLLFINTCCAGQLTSYQDTVDAINNGKSIKFVIDWDLCKTNVPNVKPNFSSSYAPVNININKDGFMQSAGMTYYHQIAILPKLGATNQAYTYTFTKNNELRVINRYLDPVTYVEKMPAIEATCQLGDGFKVFEY